MLKPLLARNRDYHPSYRGGLCNHLSMALIALERMGATPVRLERYARDYLTAMEPAPEPGTAIDEVNWRERFGDEASYADYLGFFQRAVARRGARATLRAYLPVLGPGVGAAAFHALIRTAFGIIAEDREEIAVGLAYWASRYLPLPDHQPDGGEVNATITPTADPAALLRQAREQAALAFTPDPDALIDRQMAAAAANPAFPSLAAALMVDDLTLDRLRQAAAHLFLATDDFSILHAVTGLHAARVLGDFAVDRRAFATAVWRAFLALYLSLDRPPLPTVEAIAAAANGSAPDWNAILPAAVGAEDEHVIKLVYAAFAETRAGGGRLYRHLAARKAGLLQADLLQSGTPATESRSEAPVAAAGR